MAHKTLTKKVGLVAGSFIAALLLSGGVVASADTTVYREYNPNSGEHFYTKNKAEQNHLTTIGWTDEGQGWVAPDSGTPIYRLYNPNAGEHFYTTSSYEKASLVAAGWNDEGTTAYSGGGIPVYRAYNPNSGQHNYTTSQYEQKSIIKAGWHDEGIAWYAVAQADPNAPRMATPAQTTYNYNPTKAIQIANSYMGQRMNCIEMVTRLFDALGYPPAKVNGTIISSNSPVSTTSYALPLTKFKQVSMSQLQPGDIIVYGDGYDLTQGLPMSVPHIALYIGNGQTIAGGLGPNVDKVEQAPVNITIYGKTLTMTAWRPDGVLPNSN